MAMQKIRLKSAKQAPARLLGRMQQIFSQQRGTLELLLPRTWPESQSTIRWRLYGGPGAMTQGEVTELNQIPGLGASTRVQVWTTPSATLLTLATLPTRSRAKIQQALPFALEEQLIGEPNQLHFAYRSLEADNLAVAVTARQQVQTWLAHLRSAGMHPTGLCPAELALPFQEDSWTVVFQGDEIWVRTAMALGFSCMANPQAPPPALEVALREARDKKTAPQTLILLRPPAQFNLDAWTTKLDIPIQIQKQDFWASYHEPNPPLNLLQGTFAPSSQVRELLPAVRPAAIMLAIWMVGSLAFGGWEWWQLKNSHENMRQEMLSLFRRTFPEAQVVPDPALQMQRLLSDMQGKSGKSSNNDFLALLGSVAPVLQASPQVKLRGFQFGESRLTIDVTLPDFQTMETVKTAFSSRGIKVDVLGANSTSSGIEGRLRLNQSGRTGA